MQAPSRPKTRAFADRFELKSQAGTGGMGTVYQALDRESGRVVAVKILHGKSVTDAARFDQEASLLAELRHSGIVGYVDHGVTSHGDSYIAMEWLQGETLEERLLRGTLPPAAVAHVAARVLEALSAAHQRGIVHRDIKPSNIFLVGWRLTNTRILDFGIARRVFDVKRFTKVGSTVGTPMYTAPEQARGERDVDGRADIFSLGCVLFEALTGDPPFTGESPMEVMARICVGAVPRLSSRRSGLPPEIETLIEAMLIQDRKKRPADAAGLATAFAAIAQKLGGAEDDTSGPVPVPREVISDVEQRVVTALVVSLRAGDASSPKPPEGAKRMFPWQGDTAVLTPPPVSDMKLEEVQRLLEPLGGHIERLIDQAFLVTAPSHGGVREQSIQVARCALLLRRTLPAARLAVATGRAAMLARVPVGPLVDNLTAMLGGLVPGRVRLDDATAELLPTWFVLEGGTGERILAGEQEIDERPRQVRGRALPFVGRDREMAALRALSDECREEGVARAALVLGPAGAGKTRLRLEITEALSDDENGPELLLAHGAQKVEGKYPLLSTILQKAGVDLKQPQAQVERSLVNWLEQQTAARPMLLIIDDLHGADAGSVQIIDVALRALRGRPFMVLAFARPEVDERFPGLWSERSLERVRLPPLGRRAGQTMLKHLLGDLATTDEEGFILERWEGNPFCLEELVTVVLTGRRESPDTLCALIEARLEVVPPEARRLLRAGSIFGSEGFMPEAVLAILGDKWRRDLAEWLDFLTSREILQRTALPSGDVVYKFRQVSVREAVQRTFTPGDRALARRLARGFLEHSGKTLPDCLTAPSQLVPAFT